MSFKGYKRSIKLEFDYDQVKAGVPDVKQQMAVLNSEFKKSSAEAVASGKAVDQLGTKYDFLSNKIKIQEQEVENYRKKLETATTAKGNNTKAIQNNTVSLEIAQAKLGQTKAELDKVTKELDKQKLTLGKTSEEWEKLSDKTGEIGKNLSMKLTVPILALGAGAFKMAADLTENMNKVDQVFEGNAEIVKKWAESSLKNMGAARSTALDMAALFGDMGEGMGLSSQKVLDYSMSLAQLAGDLASYKNINIDVAKTALSSIYTGETESLKKLGVVMTEANLQEFAYAQNIKKKVSEMTQAEKVQLRYNFVMDVTKKAQGDFARTSDEASNQVRIFKEGIKELGESFGEHILPVITPVISFLNGLVEKFALLSDGTKRFIVTAAGIIAVIGPVLVALSSVFKMISNISEGMKVAKGAIGLVSKAGSAISGVLSATGSWGFKEWAIAIAGVVALLITLVALLDAVFNKGRGMDKMVASIKDAISGAGGASTQGRNIASQYINGSHRTGLDYVPYDGYIAELHRGERVVPAEQNKGGSGETFYLTLNVNMDEVDDVSKLVRIAKEFKQTKRAGVALG